MTNTLPKALQGFLTITEIDHADFFIEALFKRKFGHTPPDFPRHFVAFYRDAQGASFVAGYSHMRKFEEVYLSGGSCTEGNALRRMSQEERIVLEAHGGVWYQILKYKFAKLGSECEAFFGHCGDIRAMQVATAAGFVALEHQYLIAHWHKVITEERKKQLTDKIHAIGPF
jgi:hypothetical protein